MRTRWIALAAAVLGLYGSVTRGAESDMQYIIVPAIGQHLTIVRARPGTASNLSATTRETFPMTDATFEEAILDASEMVLRQVQGANAPGPLRARVSAGALVDQAYELDAKAVEQLTNALRPSVADPRRVRLIIVAPVRAAMRFPVLGVANSQGGFMGQGAEAGLGFYVDGLTNMYDRQTRVTNRGFLGVFANVQFLLVDFEKRSVIGREAATEGEIFTASRRNVSDPWEALTAAEKITVLRNILIARVNTCLPRLVREDK